MSTFDQGAAKKPEESTVGIPEDTEQVTVSGTHSQSQYERMDLPGILRRIENRLLALDLSARAASIAAGLTEDAIRNLRRAITDPHRRSVTIRTIERLAPVLHTSVEYLLYAAGSPEAPQAATTPIVGMIGAGGRVRFYSDSPIEQLPQWFDADTVALEIGGGPLNVYFSHWLAFYADLRREPTADLVDKLCVAKLADGRIYTLKLRKAAGGPRMFHLLGRNADPLTDQEVIWAAEIRALRPRN